MVGANSKVLCDNRGQTDAPERKNLEGASREDAVSTGRGSQLFRFSNEWIRQRHWAKLPMVGKAVLPVIASYCNSTGNAWPSEKTIAKLCGVTQKNYVLNRSPFIQHLTHLTNQSFQCERLLDEVRVFLEKSLLKEGIVGIP